MIAPDRDARAVALQRRLRRALQKLPVAQTVRMRGRVTALRGLAVRATLPSAHVGDVVRILRNQGDPLAAEIVAFQGDEVVLLPLGEPMGIGPDSLVESTGKRLSVGCGASLLGRVLDGLGRPIDGGPALAADSVRRLVDGASPDPLQRPPVTEPLFLGIRAIDGALTLGEGQRVGVFAGPGVGKSMLLGQIARQAEADVCVVCLIGERGREVREFLDECLGAEGLARSVVVCATGDAPPMVRLKAAAVATTIAESFRDAGARVLLLMDSLTRYARALREVALAAGEPPARRGYPPSVFTQLPRLLERCGTAPEGSITALYTVLVEGDELEEPVADEVRGLLDGHIVLSRQLAEAGHWPAIDLLASLSRVMTRVTDIAQQEAAARLRQLLSTYHRHRDMITLGAYTRGADARVDEALDRLGSIEAFLQQASREVTPFDETRRMLTKLSSRADPEL